MNRNLVALGKMDELKNADLEKKIFYQ